MEIQIYNPTSKQPLPQIQWNYTELKTWLSDGLKKYDVIVYDESQIAQAKRDRANLNKLADAIDGKRREMKATYLRPYEEFAAQAKELTAMVKATADAITAQIKTYDDFRKQEKQAEIVKLYEVMIGNLADLVPYERLHNPKWLNVTFSMGAVSDELGRKIDNIFAGLASIDKLGLAPDIAEQVKGVFLRKFDLADALAEKERVKKQREALARFNTQQEAQKAAVREERHEPECTPTEAEKPAMTRFSDDNTAEPIHTVVFRVRVTKSKLDLLGRFMRENGIRPERV